MRSIDTRDVFRRLGHAASAAGAVMAAGVLRTAYASVADVGSDQAVHANDVRFCLREELP